MISQSFINPQLQEWDLATERKAVTDAMDRIRRWVPMERQEDLRRCDLAIEALFHTVRTACELTGTSQPWELLESLGTEETDPHVAESEQCSPEQFEAAMVVLKKWDEPRRWWLSRLLWG